MALGVRLRKERNMSMVGNPRRKGCRAVMMVPLAWLLVAGAPVSAQVNGLVTYDFEAAREVNVELRVVGMEEQSLGSRITERTGYYEFGGYNLLLGTSIRLIVGATNPGGFVNSDGLPGTPVYAYSLTTSVAEHNDVFILTATTAEKAFSVADALYTGWYYANTVRGPPPAIPVHYPAPDRPDAPDTYYSSPDATRPEGWIALSETADNSNWADWDVILHEYGHYLSRRDKLSLQPGPDATGLPHRFGTSNILDHGRDNQFRKLRGMQFAWQEGLGTYISIAAQQVNPTGQNLDRFHLASVGDTYYTDTKDGSSARPGAPIHVDLEGQHASYLGVGVGAPKGEGDELAVARILWDLADTPNLDDDLIGLGHFDLYGALDNRGDNPEGIVELDRLDDVWDYYLKASQDDHERTLFGQVFEDHHVSPHPTGAIINATFKPTDPPPTFSWERRNNEANDTFGLFVWGKTFEQRLLDIVVPDTPPNATSYTLKQEEWAVLTDAAKASGFPYTTNFVIWGRDQIIPDGTAFYELDLRTGDYWSGAYQFKLIPEPGTAVLLALGGIGLLGRRNWSSGRAVRDWRRPRRAARLSAARQSAKPDGSGTAAKR
ncbi:MAG: PEP-CTERM sorting domain-containing protein [Planctomycetes bacterium]|nr:PEP-CTERM sorting domain-containing protein [Planctomycetota bacterium]